MKKPNRDKQDRKDKTNTPMRIDELTGTGKAFRNTNPVHPVHPCKFLERGSYALPN
jgi:hypothetical protein